jgi:GNAT superfamily N-acetyltransferase
LTPDGLLEAWIALREGAIAGHVMLCRVDPRAGPPHFILPSESGGAFALGEIKRLFVVPSARRSGAATQLLATAAHEARRRELHPVLETTADNASGIGFYVKNGWVHVGSQIASWTHPSGEHPLMHQFELPAQAMPTESA